MTRNRPARSGRPFACHGTQASRRGEPGSRHHVVSRATAKRPYFERRSDPRDFLCRLTREVHQARIEVHADCILTTHFHLPVRSPRGRRSAAMKAVQNEFRPAHQPRAPPSRRTTEARGPPRRSRPARELRAGRGRDLDQLREVGLRARGVTALFGTNMQKSGARRHHVGLIVDSAGALAISLLGWRHLRRGERDSFLQRWIHDFVVKNPGFFRSWKGRREDD